VHVLHGSFSHANDVIFYFPDCGALSDCGQVIVYVGVLVSLWLFLFPICRTSKRFFVFGWVKEAIEMKSKVCGAQGV
jgi:hypothetical protein